MQSRTALFRIGNTSVEASRSVRVHWATASGDTIFLGPADATAIPTFISGLSAANYTNIPVMGGTGRFAGASGSIAAFGAVYVNQDHQVILRYQGEDLLRAIGLPTCLSLLLPPPSVALYGDYVFDEGRAQSKHGPAIAEKELARSKRAID